MFKAPMTSGHYELFVFVLLILPGARSCWQHGRACLPSSSRFPDFGLVVDIPMHGAAVLSAASIDARTLNDSSSIAVLPSIAMPANPVLIRSDFSRSGYPSFLHDLGIDGASFKTDQAMEMP